MLSVIKDKKGLSGLIPQPIRDITHLENDGDYTTVFTSSGEEYFVVGTLKHWVQTLNSTGAGYRFFVCDRGKAVNLDRIVCLDAVFRRAYFTEDIGVKTISCSMSKDKFETILRQLVTPSSAAVRILT